MSLFEYLHLQFRLDICQEEQVAAAVLIGNDGMKTGIDTQLRVQRIARVHIYMVTRHPAECAPLAYLQSRQVDGTLAPELQVFLWKIAAHNSYQVDLTIQRGSSRKIGCRASQCFLCSGKGCLDCIESNRTNNQNGHSSILPFISHRKIRPALHRSDVR